jgi:RecB family exonuclease
MTTNSNSSEKKQELELFPRWRQVMSELKSMEHQFRTHYKYSGSSAHRWLKCPGSATLCLQISERPPGAAALEGTKAHELLHKWSSEGIKAFRACEDREMRKALIPLLRYLAQQTQDANRICYEERILLDGHQNAGGTPDIVIHHRDHTVVVDLKYGRMPVAVKNNAQLEFYALLAWQSRVLKPDYMIVAIYQPRILAALQSVTYRREEILEMQRKFTTAIERCENEQDIYIVDEAQQCRWCPAMVICPAVWERGEQCIEEHAKWT